MTNRACRAGSANATTCNPRNCSIPYPTHRTGVTAASGQEMSQNHNHRNVGSGHELQRIRAFQQGRNALHLSCNCGNCGGLLQEPFTDNDCHNAGERRRYLSGVGVHTSHPPHAHNECECERHCCGVPSLNQGRRSGDSITDRLVSTPKSSVFSVSGDFERNASPSGCMSHLPSVSKKSAMRSSSSDTTSNANFRHPKQAPKDSKNQITLHGWYLMKPRSEDSTTGYVSSPGVAVGGYRSPLKALTEFFQTARVEQRLDRSNLRTKDGLEVRLMGIIDIWKSLANGFSPTLVQYFLIGFPSTWIYMIRSLDSGALEGTIPGLPPPSANPSPSEGAVHDGINPRWGTRTLPMESNPVLCTQNPSLFTAPNQGTWRTALRRFSTTPTTSSLQDGSSDDNAVPQCELGQDRSDERTNCRKSSLGADPPVRNSGPSSETRHCPRADPGAIAAENTSKGPEGSNQARKPMVLRDSSISGFDGDAVGDAGEDPGSCTQTQKSRPIIDISVLPAVGIVGEDECEVPESSNEVEKIPVVTDSPFSGIEPEVGCKGPENASSNTGTGVIELEDLTFPTQDSAVDHGERAELADVHVPCTPLQISPQVMASDVSMHVVHSSSRAGAHDPSQNLQSLDTGRKLRSGRYLPVSDTPMIEPRLGHENTRHNIKTRNILLSRQTAFSDRDDGVVMSEGCNARSEDLLINRKDAIELGGLHQVPCTPLQKTRKRRQTSAGSTPTAEPEPSPVSNPQNLYERRKLRSGRHLPVLDMPIIEPAVNPVTPQVIKSRKRNRSNILSATSINSLVREATIHPVAQPSKECEAVLGNATLEEENLEAHELQEEKRISEALNSPADELHESARLKGAAIKKNHRKASNFYRSRRNRSCATLEQKQRPSRFDSSSNKHMDKPRVSVPKSLKSEEMMPMSRKRNKKADQRSKPTGRVMLNCTTSCDTDQTEENFQTGKRNGRTQNSIVPPPLPAPRVADKSKVTEAFGLKKSRYGRVLVPPLAAWCNQSIRYDMDGSIIAISDGFGSEAEFSTGCQKLNLPSHKAAKTMQRKLLEAADTNWSQK